MKLFSEYPGMNGVVENDYAAWQNQILFFSKAFSSERKYFSFFSGEMKVWLRL